MQLLLVGALGATKTEGIFTVDYYSSSSIVLSCVVGVVLAGSLSVGLVFFCYNIGSIGLRGGGKRDPGHGFRFLISHFILAFVEIVCFVLF